MTPKARFSVPNFYVTIATIALRFIRNSAAMVCNLNVIRMEMKFDHTKPINLFGTNRGAKVLAPWRL